MSDKTLMAWAIERDLADGLADALRSFVQAAKSWHECHEHESSPVQCDSLCACIPDGVEALEEYDKVHPR